MAGQHCNFSTVSICVHAIILSTGHVGLALGAAIVLLFRQIAGLNLGRQDDGPSRVETPETCRSVLEAHNVSGQDVCNAHVLYL